MGNTDTEYQKRSDQRQGDFMEGQDLNWECSWQHIFLVGEGVAFLGFPKGSRTQHNHASTAPTQACVRVWSSGAMGTFLRIVVSQVLISVFLCVPENQPPPQPLNSWPFF